MKKLNYVVSCLVVIAIATFLLPVAGVSAVSASVNTGSNFKTCHVTNNAGTTATIVSSGKEIFLQKGTALTLVSSDMHQGYIAVKTKVGSHFATVSITADDTNCMD